MKKQWLLITTMIVTLQASLFAQKARFGIQAGPTMSNMTEKFNDEKKTSDLKIGFTAGFLIDKPIGKYFSIQPALNFVQKGENYYDDYYGSSQTTLNYIELPVNFFYRATATKGFFAGIGPSLGVGISGQYKDDYGTDNIDFGSDENEGDANRLDFGGNIVTGYLFSNGLQISANFNKSFSNMVIGEAGDYYKLKNNYFSLRVGYLFNSKK